MPVEGSELRTK